MGRVISSIQFHLAQKGSYWQPCSTFQSAADEIWVNTEGS